MENLVTQVLLAMKETSDFKMAMPLKDVLKSAIIMPGVQYVMTSGTPLMPE